jgi:ribosome recycling factor
MSILEDIKKRMQASLEHFKTELKGLRTGRANPAVLDGIVVEVYGNPTPLRKLANVSAPEPRQLLITPYDPATCGPIGKAIEKANMGLQPVVEAGVVRINIPPMDQAMRGQIVKVLRKLLEDTKVTIRGHRQEANKQVKDQKAKSLLDEDAAKKVEKQVQDLTDQSCKEADKLAADKERDIMTV